MVRERGQMGDGEWAFVSARPEKYSAYTGEDKKWHCFSMLG